MGSSWVVVKQSPKPKCLPNQRVIPTILAPHHHFPGLLRSLFGLKVILGWHTALQLSSIPYSIAKIPPCFTLLCEAFTEFRKCIHSQEDRPKKTRESCEAIYRRKIRKRRKKTEAIRKTTTASSSIIQLHFFRLLQSEVGHSFVVPTTMSRKGR